MAFKAVTITATSGAQLTLAYDATHYASLTTGSGGDLTIAPSGGDTTVTGTLAVSSSLVAAAMNIGSGFIASAGNLSWNENGVRSWQMGYAVSSGNLNLVSGDGLGEFRIFTDKFVVAVASGNTTLGGTLTTSAPTGGAGAWKLGIANAVSPTSPNRTLTVDIGGTVYYIHAKTTNN